MYEYRCQSCNANVGDFNLINSHYNGSFSRKYDDDDADDDDDDDDDDYYYIRLQYLK